MAAADVGLGASFDRAWELLEAAAGDPAAALRLPVLGTLHDSAPDARVVVLRSVDRAAHALIFYTDVRAAKVADVALYPRVSVTGYDPALRLQLRLHGHASTATEGAAVEAAWAALPAHGRVAYQSIEPPGTPVEHPPAIPPVPNDAGRARFAVMTVVLDRIELLDLTIPGHRRALYIRSGSIWRGDWLVP